MATFAQVTTTIIDVKHAQATDDEMDAQQHQMVAPAQSFPVRQANTCHQQAMSAIHATPAPVENTKSTAGIIMQEHVPLAPETAQLINSSLGVVVPVQDH